MPPAVQSECLVSFQPHLSQLPNQSYAPTTAMPDLSCIGDLRCSSRQRQILNPLSEARDLICILMDTSWVHNPLSHKGNSPSYGLFMKQESANDGLQPYLACCLFQQIKFYWNIAMLICLCIISVCFYTTTAGLSSCERECMNHKA